MTLLTTRMATLTGGYGQRSKHLVSVSTVTAMRVWEGRLGSSAVSTVRTPWINYPQHPGARLTASCYLVLLGPEKVTC